MFIPPPIETRALTIGYTLRGNVRRVVHSGLDLQLYAGGVTCLLGRNGSGKSTLLRTLCGLLKPLSGEILLDSRPLESYSPEERASKVGVVLTDRDFPGAITVYELVSMGRYPHTDFFGLLGDDDHAVVRESIEMVGLTSKSDRLLAELSDGERQKAYIAKALAQECPVILLDEPTAFLDVPSRLETWETLKRLARVRQKAILLTTHDLESAIRTADLLWLLPEATVNSSGGALISGKPGDMVADGTVDSFFGTHISRTLI